MPTAIIPQDKYYLRSLHQEIGLYDRKIAHLLKYDTFPTEEARKAAAAKLQSKRNTLARTAAELAGNGVEFKTSELPPSMQTPEQAAEAKSAPEPVEPEQPAAPQAAAATFPRTFRAFDLGQEIRDYMQNRKRA